MKILFCNVDCVTHIVMKSNFAESVQEIISSAKISFLENLQRKMGNIKIQSLY